MGKSLEVVIGILRRVLPPGMMGKLSAVVGVLAGTASLISQVLPAGTPDVPVLSPMSTEIAIATLVISLQNLGIRERQDRK